MLHHKIVGHGKPVLILHGVTLDHRYMMDILEPVFEGLEGWQRIYVDLPGHGLTGGSPEIQSQDDVLNAVIDFADQYLPDQEFALIGLSRGSYLARGIVHLRPERVSGVVLIVPGGNPSSDPARLPVHSVLAADPSIRASLAESELWAFDNIDVLQHRDTVEKRRRIVAPAKALFDAAQDARVFENFHFSFGKAEESSVFTGPSLIVVGRQDSISGYLDGIDLLAKLPRASLAVLDCAGHGVAWERPELFHALIGDWLHRVDKYPGD